MKGRKIKCLEIVYDISPEESFKILY